MFDPGLAQVRFGYGRSPEVAGPSSVEEMLALLQGADKALEQFPTASAEVVTARVVEMMAVERKLRKMSLEAPGWEEAQAAVKRQRNQAGYVRRKWIAAEVMRRVWTGDALRERLVAFWADHFSAPGKNWLYRYTGPIYVDVAIRPNVMGRFEDLLIAAVTSPQMLRYLDQTGSIGPNSKKAKKRKTPLGLNENLAREILELHTLGVGGRYTQGDVRQLAELLTGLTATNDQEVRYLSGWAEPGSETVLDKVYQTRRSQISDIHEVLRDLARHPDTARHIARKLAVHFVADHPDPVLVTALEARYLETEGDLGAVVEALLRHPLAWRLADADSGNMKQPELFVSSAMRALGTPRDWFETHTSRRVKRYVELPLRTMGQPWRRPLGPDGFEEGDAYWLSPQGMGARLQWALSAPAQMLPELPDPREFVETALGEVVPGAVRFAAEAAENRREGIALVLMSPAFQRV